MISGKYTLQLKHNYYNLFKYHQALLYYYVSYIDNESYTVNATKGTSVSVIISLVATFLVGIITGGATIAVQVTAGLISTAGCAVVGGIIMSSFTEDVAATVTHYNTKYTDIYGGGTGSIFPGKKVHVTTKDSKYYDETFYEGDAPQRYSSNGYKACLNTYTGNSSFHYDCISSFVEY